MTGDLPDYYFRLRENGAAVFRLGADPRHQRIEMEPIAHVNARSGEIRPQGDRQLTGADRAAIGAWLAQRRATLAARDADEARRTVEQLNLTAHWAQTRAAAAEIEAVADALLLAMYDLRSVLVRRRAESAEGSAAQRAAGPEPRHQKARGRDEADDEAQP